jgi:hypothetical protein
MDPVAGSAFQGPLTIIVAGLEAGVGQHILGVHIVVTAPAQIVPRRIVDVLGGVGGPVSRIGGVVMTGPTVDGVGGVVGIVQAQLVRAHQGTEDNENGENK